MCLNTTVNYAALEESFELSPFGGLKHLDSKMSKHKHNQDDLNIRFTFFIYIFITVLCPGGIFYRQLMR
jgi:hypothetical protein